MKEGVGMDKLKSFSLNIVRGIAAPLVALFIFALSVGLFLSLTLLVVSIEEGTGNLSDSSMSMTWAVLIFSQGVGLSIGNCVLTIIPLGLTLLLLLLLISLIRRFQDSVLSYSTGFVCWILANAILSQHTNAIFTDSFSIIVTKSAIFYVVALIFAVYPKSSLSNILHERIKHYLPEWILHSMRVVRISTVVLLSLYACVAVITVIVWSFFGSGTVEVYYNKIGMQTGSRILTTLACLVWLPNVAMWALSWICGAGFHIGTVAKFTMVSVSKKVLPPIPVFGVFPEPIKDNLYRIISINIVPSVCVILMIIVLVHKRFCNLRIKGSDERLDIKEMSIDFSRAALTLVGISAVLTVIMSIFFSIVNGALGTLRLSSIGVDAIDSTRAVGHLTLFACAIAWIAVLVSCLAVWFIRHLYFVLITRRKSYKNNPNVESNKTITEKKPPLSAKQSSPRTVTSQIVTK